MTPPGKLVYVAKNDFRNLEFSTQHTAHFHWLVGRVMTPPYIGYFKP